MIQSITDLVAFLKHFHRRWLSKLSPLGIRDFSFDPKLIPDDLPPGLALIYRELGALIVIEDFYDDYSGGAPVGAQDCLLPVGRLKQFDNMVEFACENQGNWTARFLLGTSDPPVYCNAADIWLPQAQGFVAVCDSLNHFLTTLCLQEAVLSQARFLRTNIPVAEAFAIPLQPMWINAYYAFGEPSHHFYVSPERDVLVMDYSGIWVASLKRELRALVAPGVEIG